MAACWCVRCATLYWHVVRWPRSLIVKPVLNSYRRLIVNPVLNSYRPQLFALYIPCYSNKRTFVAQVSTYCWAAKCFITFLKIIGWIQGSTDCSRADTSLMYILTSEMWCTHPYAAAHFFFVPFHMHTAEEKIKLGCWKLAKLND